ncbi:MAG: hypothetical protein K5986_05350 [Clostridium sp.]|uniref:hypothetical protein n=1 Tax=Clostridium sp. DSM 8431 TaxID=1761781 RepID=UPI0008E6FEB3|nr:hypothetical protein [Clostridium sp. DSM 8431]MCR4943874.1 hypothetical protein [Clostridium sp.]SFU56725.1 hypothetical protein SAMN04487886_10603 [Clostridium sp. DSM 8431]
MNKIQDWIVDHIQITEYTIIALLVLSALSVCFSLNYCITIVLSIIILSILYITPNSVFNDDSSEPSDNN